MEVFQALEGFAQYGFCKSHALSFAKLTYQSAWLKVYHPAAFLAALLNNQPMGFYPCDTLIEDAKRHGVIVVPTNVNASQLRCHLLDSRTVQLGFNMIKSCGGEAAKVLVQARTQRYASLRDLMQRTNIKRQAMENLIQAGACDSFGLDRRELLWQLWLIQRTGWGENDLFSHLEPPTPGLPESGPWDRIRVEYAVQGFSVHCHPLSLMRFLCYPKSRDGLATFPENH